MEFVRFIIIYAIFNPTPKGVGYVLVSYLTYFRNPKIIAHHSLSNSYQEVIDKYNAADYRVYYQKY